MIGGVSQRFPEREDANVKIAHDYSSPLEKPKIILLSIDGGSHEQWKDHSSSS